MRTKCTTGLIFAVFFLTFEPFEYINHYKEIKRKHIVMQKGKNKLKAAWLISLFKDPWG